MPDTVDVDASLVRLHAAVREVNECINALSRGGITTQLRLTQGANRLIGMQLDFGAQSVGGDTPR